MNEDNLITKSIKSAKELRDAADSWMEGADNPEFYLYSKIVGLSANYARTLERLLELLNKQK